MKTSEQQLAGPRALTFGFLGGVLSWALILATVFGLQRIV